MVANLIKNSEISTHIITLTYNDCYENLVDDITSACDCDVNIQAVKY